MLSKKIAFFVIFTVIVLIFGNINFSQLAGANNQYFTLFQFFGPIAGAFLTPIIGAASVLIAQVASNLIAGKAFDTIAILRLMPLMLAALYFGLAPKRRILSAIIPLACIGIFLANPVGMQVWFYTLFWTIPLICALLPERVFIKSLGATFAAHSIGGAIWIWTFPSTPEFWIMLIPIVIKERLLFALGITASYVGINTALAKMPSRISSLLPKGAIDKKAVISKSIIAHI